MTNYIADTEILDRLVPYFDLTDDELLRVFAHHGLLLPEEREAAKRPRPRPTLPQIDFAALQRAQAAQLQAQQGGGLGPLGSLLGGFGQGFPQ